jgi:hypothetical protein
MVPHQTPATEFSLVEYKEAANAYFKGVDIGYTGLRSYITLNGLFAAIIAALSAKLGPRKNALISGCMTLRSVRAEDQNVRRS